LDCKKYNIWRCANAVIEAAKKEGKIVLSGTASATYRDLITSFKVDYPEIQVEYNGINAQHRSYDIIMREKQEEV
jgi:hypothetical protein